MDRSKKAKIGITFFLLLAVISFLSWYYLGNIGLLIPVFAITIAALEAVRYLYYKNSHNRTLDRTFQQWKQFATANQNQIKDLCTQNRAAIANLVKLHFQHHNQVDSKLDTQQKHVNSKLNTMHENLSDDLYKLSLTTQEILTGYRQKYRPFVPKENDVFLVSYPRSGNTWIRTILAELLYGTSGQSIADLDHFIPDWHADTQAESIIPSERHFVKSHHPFTVIGGKKFPYKKILYIVRDPRDVALSYYRYQKAIGDYSSDFSQYLFDWLNGRIWPGTWSGHLKSWYGEGAETAGFLIKTVRYEDLLSQPSETLMNMVDFLGIQVSPQQIEEVIQKTNADKMREKEAKGLREAEKADQPYFIGKARAKNWEGILTPEQLGQINKHCAEEMHRWDYV